MKTFPAFTGQECLINAIYKLKNKANQPEARQFEMQRRACTFFHVESLLVIVVQLSEVIARWIYSCNIWYRSERTLMFELTRNPDVLVVCC